MKKYKVIIARKIEQKDLSLGEAISLKESLDNTFRKVHLEEQK